MSQDEEIRRLARSGDHKGALALRIRAGLPEPAKFPLTSGLSVVSTASQCGDHPCEAGEIVAKLAVRTLYFDESCSCGIKNEDGFGRQCGSMCDTGSVAVLLLADGRFAYAHEDSDTTGHGCQCSGGVEVFDDVEMLLALGVGDAARDHAAKHMDRCWEVLS